MYNIKKLTPEDWPLIEKILDSRSSIQGVKKDNPKWIEGWKSGIQFRLTQKMYNNFGAFDDKNVLVSFYESNRWPDYQNYSVSLLSTDKSLDLPKAEGTRFPIAVIELSNHIISFYEKERRHVYWTLGVKNAEWLSLADCKQSVLSNTKKYKKEIVFEVPAGMSLINTPYEHVALGFMPTINYVIKRTNIEMEPFKLPDNFEKLHKK